jgi:dolichol kinase
MQPLLWGDSFGEIIGSFFGKWKFNVYGLGDVNQKTVEGTFAVFLSSFIAQVRREKGAWGGGG